MSVRIFIVEDELMAIEYLKTLLKECGEEYQVVGEAMNGAKAVPEIERLCPDVVFADICMPVMDGLEMSEKIMGMKTPPVVFILSSYRDFDYAKKGLKVGVKDYILKNDLSADLLKDLLNNAKIDIENDSKNRHIILEHNVREFLRNSSTDSDPEESLIYSEKPLQRYALIHVLCPAPFSLTEEVEEQKYPVDCYEINRMETPEGISCAAFLEAEKSKFVALIFIQPSCRNERIVLERYASELRERVSLVNPHTRVVISKIVTDFIKIPDLYASSKEMLYYLYDRNEKDVFWEEELRSAVPNIDVGSIVTRFRNTLEKGKISENRDSLKECIKSLRGVSFKTYLSLMEALYGTVYEYAKEKKIDPDTVKIPRFFNDVSNLEQVMFKVIDRLSDHMKERSENNYSHYVVSAMDYIHNNYMRDISIADIAEAVNLSEGHLRRLFKQETGEKIVSTLMNSRIEHAKKMMEEGNMNLEEIWRATGFSSAQYFSFAFKQKEGMAPREYLKKAQTGKKDE